MFLFDGNDTGANRTRAPYFVENPLRLSDRFTLMMSQHEINQSFGLSNPMHTHTRSKLGNKDNRRERNKGANIVLCSLHYKYYPVLSILFIVPGEPSLLTERILLSLTVGLALATLVGYILLMRRQNIIVQIIAFVAQIIGGWYIRVTLELVKCNLC